VGKHRESKFGIEVVHSKFQPLNDKPIKPSMKEVWLHHMTHFYCMMLC